MAKLSLLRILSGFASNTALDTNSQSIETAMENTVSRDGTAPNFMLANFDMNSYKIVNLGAPTNPNDAVRYVDVQSFIATGFPDQTGNSDKFLTTNGTIVSWGTPDISTYIHTATNKATLDNTDEVGIWDNISTALRKVTWATIKSYFVEKTSATGSAVIPAGTTAQRDGSPQVGYTRYNTTLNRPEAYSGAAWLGMGGATGAGGDDVFYENGTTVTTSYTLTTGKNAMSTGPITINTGVAVTIPTGQRWVIL